MSKSNFIQAGKVIQMMTNKALIKTIAVIILLLPVSALADGGIDVGGRHSTSMVFIKGGCFDMGDQFGDGEDNEKPVHEVCVDDYYLGEHEVTVGEFREFVNETSYRTDSENIDGCYYWTGFEWRKDRKKYWDDPGFPQTDKNPVTCVSWNDTNEFIKWKKRKTNFDYRLPTEAEWEYAAREGGRMVRFSTGKNTIGPNDANFDASSKFEKPYSRSGVSKDNPVKIKS